MSNDIDEIDGSKTNPDETGPEESVQNESLLYLDERDASSDGDAGLAQFSPDELQERIIKLEKINLALVQQVERNMSQRATGYSLFQSAVMLEEQVRARTVQLRSALDELESSNEDLSKAKELAELSDKSKTRFIASASHDLLQPLSSARLNISSLKSEDVSIEAGELIGKIDRSLLTIEELLRTLFDISKLDAGVSVPDICVFSGDRIIKGLLDDFGGFAKQKGLSLRTYPKQEDGMCDPIFVESDPIFLRRILQNFVSNALRYTESGGVLIGRRRRGNYLRYEVWDTGRGIQPKEIDKIFDEFHRGERSDNPDGLGLGLAIVQRMSRAIGHDIQVRSVYGKGSVFSVTVPVRFEHTEDDKEELSSEIVEVPELFQLEDSFIILIEDDPDVSDAMLRLFNKWGAYCLTGDSWTSISEKLASIERPPDLIVADYNLADPVVGPEVVRNVRLLFDGDGGREIPAVVVTATPSNEIMKHALEANCEFITKPVEPAELRLLLFHMLNR